MRWGETLIDIGSLPTEVVCPSGFKPSVTPSVYLIFIGSFFGYSTQLLNLSVGQFLTLIDISLKRAFRRITL